MWRTGETERSRSWTPRRTTVAATIPVGTFPAGLALHSATRRLYVANFLDDTVSVINTDTLSVLSTIPVARRPRGLAVDAAGQRLFVAGFDDGRVQAIDTGTGTVTLDVASGGLNPLDLMLGPRGTRLYVAHLQEDAGRGRARRRDAGTRRFGERARRTRCLCGPGAAAAAGAAGHRLARRRAGRLRPGAGPRGSRSDTSCGRLAVARRRRGHIRDGVRARGLGDRRRRPFRVRYLAAVDGRQPGCLASYDSLRTPGPSASADPAGKHVHPLRRGRHLQHGRVLGPASACRNDHLRAFPRGTGRCRVPDRGANPSSPRRGRPTAASISSRTTSAT